MNIIIINNKYLCFKIKICLDDSLYWDYIFVFILEFKEKKLFCGLWIFEYEDNFFVDRENYIFVGLLVRIFWFFCVVFDVVFFVMFFVYDV